ncbi:hypothetical protein BDR03DRAFT_980691 [Suillus americanus]|nr:hypothetical protein BDR03DRAFT_980691 [Suillus americanus]
MKHQATDVRELHTLCIKPAASALTPGPAVPVIVPAAPAIPVLGPAKTTIAPDPSPTILLPAQPTPTVASAGVVQGAAAVAVTAAYEFPPAAAEVLPNDVEILPAVAAAPSSGRRGRGRQAGMLAPVSSGPADQSDPGKSSTTATYRSLLPYYLICFVEDGC